MLSSPNGHKHCIVSYSSTMLHQEGAIEMTMVDMFCLILHCVVTRHTQLQYPTALAPNIVLETTLWLLQ